MFTRLVNIGDAKSLACHPASTTHRQLNPAPGVDIDRNSWGPALQVGVDIPLSKGLYLNFDLKKVYIRTDVSLAGNKIGEFKVDPLLVGVGLGWRF